MDPLTITSAALAIAKATGLTDWLGRKIAGPPGEQVSRRIVETAQSVVGGKSPTEILKRVEQETESASQTRAQIRALIIGQETDLLKLAAADTIDARALYRQKSTQANRIATSIMRFNLPAIILLIAGNGGALYYINNPTVAVAIGNLIGASIASLWQERQQIMGFFFGTSLSSQEKTELLTRQRAR